MTTTRHTRARRTTELGEELQCAQCREFWPADREFFYFNNGRAHSWCKACYASAPSTIAKKKRWLAKQRLSAASAQEAAA